MVNSSLLEISKMPKFVALQSLAFLLACAPQITAHPVDERKPVSIVDGAGNRVDMREVFLRDVGPEAKLDPEMLRAVLTVWEYRQTTERKKLLPSELEWRNLVVHVLKNKIEATKVEVRMLPLPPVGAGLESVDFHGTSLGIASCYTVNSETGAVIREIRPC